MIAVKKSRFFLLFLLILLECHVQKENHFEQGLMAYSEGNCARSLELFNKVVQENPKDIQAIYNRGLSYLCIKKYRAALEDFEHCIHINNVNCDYISFKALCLLNLGFTDSAYMYYNMSLKIDSTHPNTLSGLGVVYLDFDSLNKAYYYLSKAKGYLNDFSPVYYNLGTIFGKLSIHDSAIHYYKMAIELDSLNSEYHANIAAEYNFIDSFELAINSATIAININKMESISYLQRAIAKSNLGDNKGACDDLKLGLRYQREVVQEAYNEFCR
jgi:tetratricopeptide (TPR) repeat protein